MRFDFQKMTPLHEFRNMMFRARAMRVVHGGTVYEQAELDMSDAGDLTITLMDTKPEKKPAKKAVRKK